VNRKLVRAVDVAAAASLRAGDVDAVDVPGVPEESMVVSFRRADDVAGEPDVGRVLTHAGGEVLLQL